MARPRHSINVTSAVGEQPKKKSTWAVSGMGSANQKNISSDSKFYTFFFLSFHPVVMVFRLLWCSKALAFSGPLVHLWHYIH